MLLIQQHNCRDFLIDAGNGHLHSNVASICNKVSPLLPLLALLLFLPLQIVEKVHQVPANMDGGDLSKFSFFFFLWSQDKRIFVNWKSGEGQRAILVWSFGETAGWLMVSLPDFRVWGQERRKWSKSSLKLVWERLGGWEEWNMLTVCISFPTRMYRSTVIIPVQEQDRTRMW